MHIQVCMLSIIVCIWCICRRPKGRWKSCSLRSTSSWNMETSWHNRLMTAMTQTRHSKFDTKWTLSRYGELQCHDDIILGEIMCPILALNKPIMQYLPCVMAQLLPMYYMIVPWYKYFPCII